VMRSELTIWRVKPWGFESPLSHQICLQNSGTRQNTRLGALYAAKVLTRQWVLSNSSSFSSTSMLP